MFPVTLLLFVSCLQLLFDVGIIDVSAVSVKTGVISVVAVLPAAAIISFLFRLHVVKLSGSQAQGRNAEKDLTEGKIYA